MKRKSRENTRNKKGKRKKNDQERREKRGYKDKFEMFMNKHTAGGGRA